MKRLLFPVIILSSLVSHNAFATHAYRTENCVSSTHKLFYKGNYPVGGMYGVSSVDWDNETTALPLFDVSETPTTLEDAEIVFNTKSSTIISKTPSASDCGFEHEEWTSEKIIDISLISDSAAKALGLKQGEQMTFICEESTDYPDGSDCK